MTRGELYAMAGILSEARQHCTARLHIAARPRVARHLRVPSASALPRLHIAVRMGNALPPGLQRPEAK
jgi:hypothetical protein